MLKLTGMRHKLNRRLQAGFLTIFWFAALHSSQAYAKGPSVSSIPNIAVLNQNGKPMHFVDDLVKGKIIALNFAYTSCTTYCPQQGQHFQHLQDALGSHFGQDIFLVTVTTDPEHDTPAALKAWASKFGARPGWTLVTGVPADVEQLLQFFGIYNGNKDGRHSPLVVMINEPRNLIKNDFSLTSPTWITQALTTWRDN